jgi:hypothetical protein
MPKKDDGPKAPEVTWQDELAQASERAPTGEKEWKKVRKADRKDQKTLMERQRAARLARDAK